MASTITVGSAAGKGEKEIMTRYPVEEGLAAGTQKQKGRTSNLVAVNSVVLHREKKGLSNDR